MVRAGLAVSSKFVSGYFNSGTLKEDSNPVVEMLSISDRFSCGERSNLSEGDSYNSHG